MQDEVLQATHTLFTQQLSGEGYLRATYLERNKINTQTKPHWFAKGHILLTTLTDQQSMFSLSGTDRAMPSS